jgi:hypothetical protein
VCLWFSEVSCGKKFLCVGGCVCGVFVCVLCCFGCVCFGWACVVCVFVWFLRVSIVCGCVCGGVIFECVSVYCCVFGVFVFGCGHS